MAGELTTYALSQGIGLVTGAGAAYTFAQFLAGGNSVDYDSKLFSTTQWQDSAGTTPVTASGQKVGLWTDASGNGFSASQGTSGARLNSLLTGSRMTTFGDASDDNLLTSFLCGVGSMTLFMDVDVPATIATTQLIAGTSGASNGNFFLGWNTAGNLVGGVGTDSTTVIKDSADWRGQQCIAALVLDNTNNLVKIFTANGEAYSGAKNGVPNTTVPWRIGARNNNASPVNFSAGRLARLSGAPKAITLAQFVDMRLQQISYNS